MPPSSPTPVTARAHKKATVMGRLPPFICLAHCTARCEAVISVKNKFVGANKAASCGACKHNMATHGALGPDAAPAGLIDGWAEEEVHWRLDPQLNLILVSAYQLLNTLA